MKTTLPKVTFRPATAVEVAGAYGLPLWVAERYLSDGLDSTPAQPAVTGKHVHVRPENAAPASRAPSDQAAGHGEHEGHNR